MFEKVRKIFRAYGMLRQAFGKHKNKVLIMTFLGLASGFLGGIGIGAIVPLFSFLMKTSSENLDPISKLIQGAFSIVGLSYRLRYLIVLIAVLFVSKAIFLFLANYVNYRASVEYEKQTRQEIFEHAMKADWGHLMREKIGHLSTVIMDSTNIASALLNNISMVILFLTSLITYAVIALNISYRITLVTFAIGAVLFVILGPLFKKIRQLSHDNLVVTKQVTHHINQHILGAKTVKTMAVEKEVLRKSRFYFSELGVSRLGVYKYNSVLGTFLEPITLAVIIPIFALSYHNPSFNIASFAAILYLVQKMFSFMQSMQIRLSLINEEIPHLKNVLSYQEEAKRYKEKDNGKLAFSFKNSIEFKDLEFSYNPDSKILKGLNMKIEKGETVGLVGPSGSGKTTLVDLALRLLSPDAGEINIDGEDVSKINLHDWRSNIGYVSQDIFLLNDTIENNIKFYNSKVDERAMIDAAKKANIYDFISTLPNGFSTVVGERGLQLSVGQRQRVVLARVLAFKPEILILDEATSALDNESEAAIQKAIFNLRREITILIIAHRLSTIMNADKVFVLGEGRIIESGAPEELVKDKGSYIYRATHANL